MNQDNIDLSYYFYKINADNIIVKNNSSIINYKINYFDKYSFNKKILVLYKWNYVWKIFYIYKLEEFQKNELIEIFSKKLPLKTIF